MIGTATVVHLTPAQKYCSKETSEQACRDASTPDVECYWCDDSSVCTSAFDQYAKIWLENDCKIAVMGEDNKGDSSSSTSNLNPTETTSTSPETSNQQLEATTKTIILLDTSISSSPSLLSVQNINSGILLIIVVSVGCLLVLLIVLAIWLSTKNARCVLHLMPASNPFALITHQYPAVARSIYPEQIYHITHSHGS
ncbi:hypothetical protein EWB00_001580 [Schistosoma japonicum]|uniref:Uncharacterized protein n=1 Tax=Schistosoma japonicum TaxID=6182 RepID=A0A4Z2DFB5_SCHJA|nr:hypothetical protein EWB00_001580 [Schistosoma japonicum]